MSPLRLSVPLALLCCSTNLRAEDLGPLAIADEVVADVTDAQTGEGISVASVDAISHLSLRRDASGDLALDWASALRDQGRMVSLPLPGTAAATHARLVAGLATAYVYTSEDGETWAGWGGFDLPLELGASARSEVPGAQRRPNPRLYETTLEFEDDLREIGRTDLALRADLLGGTVEVYASGADVDSITLRPGDGDPVSIPVDPAREGWQFLGEYAADPGSPLLMEVAEGQDLPARIRLVETSFLDEDGDGMADLWELRHGLDAADPSDAALDPDGDGIGNLREFVEVLDPNRANVGLDRIHSTVYVDSDVGSDAEDGHGKRRGFASRGRGPKRTIGAGVRALPRDRAGTLVLQGEAAHPLGVLDPGGRTIVIQPEGRQVLGASADPLATAPDPFPAPTRSSLLPPGE